MATGDPSDGLARPTEIVVPLLAQGIVAQFERMRDNRTIIRQHEDALHALLIKGASSLAALYMVEGREDRASSPHLVMELACRPVREWGIQALAFPESQYANVVLIDPETRIPTWEARDLASSVGFGEDNLLEDLFHSKLRELVKKGQDGDTLYSKIRLLVTTHAVLARAESSAFFEEIRFPAGEAVVNQFFREIPANWLHAGDQVHICERCSSLLRPDWDRATYPDGKCLTRICRSKGPTRAARQMSYHPGILLAHPQIIEYWVGPAIDERTIFAAAQQSGREPILYPMGDACDVAFHGKKRDGTGSTTVGVDAKNYSSPWVLINRLNRDIGRLKLFGRPIIAIGDELVDSYGVYMQTLNAMKTGEALQVEFMTVEELCRKLKEGVV